MISHQPSLDHPSLIAPIQRVYASGGPNLPTEISSRFCASERRSSWTVGKEVSEDILKPQKVERSPQPQKWRALHFLAPKVAQSPLLSPKSGTHTMCPHASLQTQFAHMYISHSQLPNRYMSHPILILPGYITGVVCSSFALFVCIFLQSSSWWAAVRTDGCRQV